MGPRTKELLKSLEKNHDLGDKAKAMWSEGASAQEVADALTETGLEVDAEQVEHLLAALQASRAEAAGNGEKVDRDQLKAVAGGSVCETVYLLNDPHRGGCSSVYYTTECSATVEADSWCWSNDACMFLSVVYSCVSTRE